MRLRWLHMRIVNFRAFQEQEFQFPESGLLLVEGRNLDGGGCRSNGAGKSSFFEAMFWCLYGTSLRKGAKADAVLARRPMGKEPTEVTLTFSVDDVNYQVQRTRTRRGKTTLTITGPEGVVSDADVKAAQKQVDGLLGLDEHGFRATCYFTGRDRFGEGTDKDQKLVLERLMDLERLGRAAKRTRTRLREAQAARAAIALSLAALRERARELSASLTRDRASRELFVAEADQRLDEAVAAHAAAAAALAKAATAVSSEGPPPDPEGFRPILEGVEAQHAEAQQVLATARALHSDALAKAAPEGGTVCPECLQAVPHDHAENVAETYREAVESRARSLDKAVAHADKLAGGLTEANAIMNDLVARRGRRERMEAELTRAEADEDAAARLVGERRRERETVGERYDGMIAELQEKLREVRAEELGKEAEDEDLAGKAAALEYWERAFGLKGLRSLVLDDVMPVLNAELDRILGRLTDGYLRVQIYASGVDAKGEADGKMSLLVSSDTGGGSYADCSRGERARVDLPITLALAHAARQRRGVDPGILIADEALDDMESVGGERVLPILEGDAGDRPIFVITHHVGLSQLADRMLVTKRGGVATLSSATKEEAA